MRWLGASPGTPEALSLAEAVNIRWLAVLCQDMNNYRSLYPFFFIKEFHPTS